jgi:hypothetical protein
MASGMHVLIRCTNWQHTEGPLLDHGGRRAEGRVGVGLAIFARRNIIDWWNTTAEIRAGAG